MVLKLYIPSYPYNFTRFFQTSKLHFEDKQKSLQFINMDFLLTFDISERLCLIIFEFILKDKNTFFPKLKLETNVWSLCRSKYFWTEPGWTSVKKQNYLVKCHFLASLCNREGSLFVQANYL